MSRCLLCGGNLTRIRHDTTFQRDGLTFHLKPENAAICVKCEREQIWTHFKVFEGKLVKRRGESLFTVDWGYFLEKQSMDEHGSLAAVLQSLGVLQTRLENGWVVLDGLASTVLVPSSLCSRFFFVRQSDAVDYARKRRGKGRCGFLVAYVDKVVACFG